MTQEQAREGAVRGPGWLHMMDAYQVSQMVLDPHLDQGLLIEVMAQRDWQVVSWDAEAVWFRRDMTESTGTNERNPKVEV